MRVVQRQPVQPGVDGVRPADPPMAVNRCAVDIFRAVEQLFAAIGADDVAEQPPPITDVLALAEMLRPGVYHRLLECCVAARSDERRVGTECVSQCSSRWEPDP